MVRKMKNGVPRARFYADQIGFDRDGLLRSVKAVRINSLTIRRRLSYKWIPSSTEDHDADDEDPYN